jgi:ATP-dependent Clp protease ATP-binding subunit ClpC
MDEAGALVKMWQPREPEIEQARKRITSIVRSLEKSIANHEFEKARFWERKERQQLHELAQKYKKEAARAVVTRDDIENAVALRTGMSVAAVRQSRGEDAQRNKEQKS